MSDKRWIIYSMTQQYGKTVSCTIGEGTNSYGDGPERIVGSFASEVDADEICKLHNHSIDLEDGAE